MTRRTRTKVSVHGCEPEEMIAIAEKYDLEFRTGETSTWICLAIPEADTEISWFRKKSEV